MLEKLKQEVFEANLALMKHNLVILTWGNVSAVSEEKYMVIKPSGVDYEKLRPEDMVVTDMQGNIIEGNYRPSSDTPTHLELYKAYPQLKGICHTHSTYATAFAQAGMELDCLGTTHADYFYGSIPCTRKLKAEEVANNYEENTGKVIIETLKDKAPLKIPAALVYQHGVFCWGTSAALAVQNALIVEEIAKINFNTLLLSPYETKLAGYILDKHYLRKHGENSYYGQVSKEKIKGNI